MPRSVLILIPYCVPFHTQLLTVRLLIPLCVGLPIDTPCPLPNVQLEIMMSDERAELLPIWILSSPSLIEQPWINTFVEARSIPSVLAVFDAVLILMFCIVRLMLPLCTMIWNVGAFCRFSGFSWLTP